MSSTLYSSVRLFAIHCSNKSACYSERDWETVLPYFLLSCNTRDPVWLSDPYVVQEWSEIDAFLEKNIPRFEMKICVILESYSLFIHKVNRYKKNISFTNQAIAIIHYNNRYAQMVNAFAIHNIIWKIVHCKLQVI